MFYVVSANAQGMMDRPNFVKGVHQTLCTIESKHRSYDRACQFANKNEEAFRVKGEVVEVAVYSDDKQYFESAH